MKQAILVWSFRQNIILGSLLQKSSFSTHGGAAVPLELRGLQREGHQGGHVIEVCLKILLPDSGQYTNNSGILIFETNITHPLRSTMLSLSLYAS